MKIQKPWARNQKLNHSDTPLGIYSISKDLAPPSLPGHNVGLAPPGDVSSGWAPALGGELRGVLAARLSRSLGLEPERVRCSEPCRPRIITLLAGVCLGLQGKLKHIIHTGNLPSQVKNTAQPTL
ncbi:hypothetical protein XELAEV_18029449mg [Xenopus laevis]|uniref:Uncharacterized protein n=1 Tax=Xenopus laevis TaxID=8355 RepID=A0A974CRN3_XENLA|nr:hypothetical protein XELAEV_18029449mg [Xenopus laevis]